MSTHSDNQGNYPMNDKPTTPPPPYRFTPDELRVLRECNYESFYQRCLPLSTGLGVVIYYGVKSGKLIGHPRWGAVPKVAVAAICGYFLGKISYQQKCAEKLMALPDSPIGQALRQRKNQPNLDKGQQEGGFQTFSFTEIPQLPPQQSYLDLDADRPPFSSSASDFERPLGESELYLEPSSSNDRPLIGYDELRKKNREEHEQQRRRYSGGVDHSGGDLPTRAVSGPPQQQLSSPTTTVNSTKPKNKYGDDME